MTESPLTRLVAMALGVVFGFVLCWTQLTNPDVIRQMLLLQSAYVYLMLFTAMGVGFAGAHLLRRARARALVTGEPIGWKPEGIERRHVVGSAIFGLGWSLSESCPGPIAAQLGQGMFWSLCTIAGTGIGIALYLRQRAPKRASRSRAISSHQPQTVGAGYLAFASTGDDLNEG